MKNVRGRMGLSHSAPSQQRGSTYCSGFDSDFGYIINNKSDSFFWLDHGLLKMEKASCSRGARNASGSSKSSSMTSSPQKSDHATTFYVEDSSELEEADTSGSEDVVEVGKHNQDYFEIPHRRKKDRGIEPLPPTKDLVAIPKDKLIPFKDLYEKQPQKIKEMMRVTFCDAKPITNPPPLGLFVNRVRQLQDKKKNKKHLQRKQLRDKLKVQPQSDGKRSKAKVNLVDICENDTQLVHVDYPGRIVHVDKALETMGGIGQITKVFNNVNKKLNVKFRSDDPWCNPVKGEASPAVGILLRVRYRKPVENTKQRKNETSKSTPGTNASRIEQVDDDSIIINGVRVSKSQILYEDNQLLKNVTSQGERTLNQYHQSDDLGNSYLRIPKNYKPTVDERIRIETLGLINRTYKFEGICDYQYIPSKTTKSGTSVSTRNQLFPILGNPTENNDSLFVCDELFHGVDRDEYTDFLPPMMSRIDKPVESIIEHMLDSDNIKLSAELKEKSGVIATTRARRNVYTIFYNFQSEKQKSNTPVPLEPLKGALEDVKKRSQYEASLGQLKKCFEDKPIWSKVALEFELKKSSLTLKFALPCVSYFATNGPWRALWIRFGYDPREHQSSFIYQTVDFRVPGIYKCFMDELDKIDETFYIFRPNLIPPRGQMFYQLSHLKCEEMHRLIDIASKKASKSELSYDMRFGWLKEGTFEYIRHVIVQYIESYLEELGKISEYRSSKIFLPDGQLESTEKLVPRPRTIKRIRKVRSYKPKPSGRESTATSSNKRTSSKRKGKESSGWAYQGILEDLSIKEINKYGTRKDDEIEILDEDSLLSDDFDEASSSENSEEFEDDDAEVAINDGIT